MKKALSTVVSKAFHRYRRTPESDRVTQAAAGPRESIHVVYEGSNPTVDIVAVHGLGGDWKWSWTDRASDTFWLADLLPKDVPETRIMSLGYDASQTSSAAMEDVAAAMLAQLAQVRIDSQSESRPIVFLAHSLGGPLLKGALGLCSETEDGNVSGNIKALTYGILFFGVPQRGHDGYKNLAAIAETEADATESPLMKTYRRDAIWMQESNAAFCRTCGDLEIKYFAESANPEVAPIHSVQTPPNDSIDAVGTINAPSGILLGKTHGAMIRFPNAQDRDYQIVSSYIKEMVVGAAKTNAVDGSITHQIPE